MSELKKDVKPLDDFNWDEFEVGTSAGISKDDLDKEGEKSQTKAADIDHKIVNGKIISKDRKEVVVNIGYKSDGIIPASEFRYNPNLKIGDNVEVYIVHAEDNGQLILSHKRARLSKSWDRIKLAFDDDRIVQGFVKPRTNGGMIVDVFGIDTFLPDSQIDVHPIHDYDQLVGKTMEFRIVQINNDPEFVVISHRAITDPNYDAYPFSKEINIAIESGVFIDNDYYSKDYDEEYEEFLENAFGEERRKAENPPDISQMVHTYGRLLPCPHCGSRYVDTYCDGTAKCRDCNKWYYYA